MLCSMAVCEFTTTGLTTKNKFIGFMVLVLKTPMKKELLPSSQ